MPSTVPGYKQRENDNRLSRYQFSMTYHYKPIFLSFPYGILCNIMSDASISELSSLIMNIINKMLPWIVH